MITFFSEQDLISFGNFCRSKVREEIYLKQGIPADKIAETTSTVSGSDVANWYNYLISLKKVTEEAKENKEAQNEG